MLSTMTGEPGGNASRVMVILAWPGTTALTSWAGGFAEQPAQQTARRSEPQIRTRMTGAAYACKAKYATAPAGGDVLHGAPGGLN